MNKALDNAIRKLSPVIAIAMTLAIIVSLIFIPPYFEMRSYNRLTCSNATYVDALFLELRVMEQKDCDNF